MQRRLCLLAVALGLAHGGCASTSPFFLKDGERIVFFGDSITENGAYVQYVDAFLRTRFPHLRFEVLNRGISSETIAGTSEADHTPRRPDAHERFARDIVTARPDVLVACFGMNDGNYFPFAPERFAKYRDGVRRLIARTRSETGARLVLMTPPPYDPYTRKVFNPAATQYGYKFACIDYDSVLDRYSRWLLTLRGEGIVVADVHAALKDHLRRRRETRVSFSLQNDGIHPNATGHWLMAQTLLEAWRVPSVVSEVEVDGSALDTTAADTAERTRPGGALPVTWRTSVPTPSAAQGDGKPVTAELRDGALSVTWFTPLPMPIDPQWDKESVAVERVAERFNRHRLRVTGLPPGRYRLLAEGAPVADVDHTQLGRGLDLLDYPTFPTTAMSQVVLDRVRRRERALYAAWREGLSSAPAATQGAERYANRLEAARCEANLRDLCRVHEIHVRIEPAGP